MNFKNILSIISNFVLYLFGFLFLFFIIHRAYIYSFDLNAHPCMSDKCIREREKYD